MKLTQQTISSKNSYKLSFTVFEPEKTDSKNITVLIAPAMAVLQKYYHKFAEYLCELGYHVVTFDYLGIGSSLFDFKDYSVTYQDWATYDITLLITWIKDNLKTEIYYIAHSAGGQLLGLTPANTNITKVFIISAGIGYWKNWSFPRKYFYLFSWYFLFPFAIKVYGYSPAWAMGKKVPKGIIKQWLYWGRKKRFMLDDPTITTYFSNIKVPVKFIIFSDDTYAPHKNAKALASFYDAAKVDFYYIHPKDYGFKEIGHFGFFKSQFKDRLWPILDL